MPGFISTPPPFTPWRVEPNTVWSSAAVFSAANSAYIAPLYVPYTVQVANYAFTVAVQSGNYDVGIYTGTLAGGLTRLWSKGSTAVPAAGLVTTAISGGLTLPAGYYWVAFACDNTTAQFVYDSVQANSPGTGVVVSTAFALPSTIAAGSLTTRTTRKLAVSFLPSTSPGA